MAATHHTSPRIALAHATELSWDAWLHALAQIATSQVRCHGPLSGQFPNRRNADLMRELLTLADGDAAGLHQAIKAASCQPKFAPTFFHVEE